MFFESEMSAVNLFYIKFQLDQVDFSLFESETVEKR